MRPARRAPQFVPGCLLFSLLLAGGAVLVQVASGSESGRGMRAGALSLRPGRPERIGGWRLEGDSVIARVELLGLLPRSGVAFDRAAVDRAATAILSAHEDGGYPFAEVKPLTLAEESGFVYPVLQVAAGPKVDVGFLEFAGRPMTRPALLERIAGFSGGTYSGAKVARWRQSLEQSGLVDVDSQKIVEDGSGYGVRFWVTGRRVNRATGVAGYSPADRRFTGLLEASFRNLFDSGRRLEVRWQSAYGMTGYRLGYTEPWVLATPIDLSVSARQSTVDTTSGQTSLAASADARAAAWTVVSLETGYDRFTDVPSRTSADMLWVGTGVVLDSRDFPANPRSGIRVSALTRVGNRSTDSAGAAVVTHIELGLNSVLPVGQLLTLSSVIGARVVYSAANLTLPELYTVGGPGTVRGYREDEFHSTRVGWVSTELRYSLGRTSRVFPFIDVGAYQDSGGWKAAPGYGAGMRVATQAGVFGLDYGVAVRDNPLRGKVHLSYDVTF